MIKILFDTFKEKRLIYGKRIGGRYYSRVSSSAPSGRTVTNTSTGKTTSAPKAGSYSSSTGKPSSNNPTSSSSSGSSSSGSSSSGGRSSAPAVSTGPKSGDTKVINGRVNTFNGTNWAATYGNDTPIWTRAGITRDQYIENNRASNQKAHEAQYGNNSTADTIYDPYAALRTKSLNGTEGSVNPYVSKSVSTNIRASNGNSTAPSVAFEAPINYELAGGFKDPVEDVAMSDELYVPEGEGMPDDNVIPEDPDNPFDQGTDAGDLWDQMKGLLTPSYDWGREREDELNKQKKDSTDFIKSQSDLKREMLERQLGTEKNKKESGIEKVRRGTKAQTLALEEGRKRSLRYLKGALAKRGSFGTTGTGQFSLAALTGQYDIKTAELKGKAQDAILDINDTFDTIVTTIQNNQLLNESEKTGLMLKLNQETANAIDTVMRDIANQETSVASQAFSLSYQAKLAKEERDRAKRKELRDYYMNRMAQGEYVDPEQLAYVADGDSDIEALLEQGQQTGREFDSKAVTNVYENMLGPQWASKMNPNTGQTFKDDATQEVVRLVQEEAWTLEDALNRVRSAIRTSPEYAAYMASKTSSGSTGGKEGTKVGWKTYTYKGEDDKWHFYDVWKDNKTGISWRQTFDGNDNALGEPEQGGQFAGSIPVSYDEKGNAIFDQDIPTTAPSV